MVDHLLKLEDVQHDAVTADRSDSLVDRDALRNKLLAHFNELRIHPWQKNDLVTKDSIRFAHAKQRAELTTAVLKSVGNIEKLVDYFADGKDVQPSKIRPQLIPVQSGKLTGKLFRFASLTWAIPVSPGFGRRLRYLVLDDSNKKLIGLIALGDPVFNLTARDEWIDWSSEERMARLSNVMDAYVLGAVPPYNRILGGKLIGSLLPSTRIYNDFRSKYGQSTGIISGEAKRSRLALITVTSALGRSSVYNRLVLRDPATRSFGHNPVEFVRLGYSKGWGHFHVSDALFFDLRKILTEDNHQYVSDYRFGDGPNWKIRVIRAGFKTLGLDQHLLKHGLKREVFGVPIVSNWRKVLSGRSQRPTAPKMSVTRLAELAKDRWVIPRSERMSDFRDHDKRIVINSILGSAKN